ncbi:MAG: hypothetical protein WAW87_06365 [Candidatus Ferrigenium altingense]
MLQFLHEKSIALQIWRFLHSLNLPQRKIVEMKNWGRQKNAIAAAAAFYTFWRNGLCRPKTVRQEMGRPGVE